MPELAQIGVTGLAVMGRNLARNFARHGHSVAIHNRSYAKTESLLAEAGSEGTFVPSESMADFIAPKGAGHFVKMVRNGIEYADMQLIAEAYDLIKQGTGASSPEIGESFQTWNEGDLESYLIEITAEVLGDTDAETGKPFVDIVLDRAEQMGTARWTVQNALDLGVPITSISEATMARAQRDFFGAHTYQRVDRESTFHTEWSGDRTEHQVGPAATPDVSEPQGPRR